MATQIYANNARSTLNSAILLTDLTLQVVPGDGAKFPNPTGTQFFMATIEVGSSNEIVQVTARSTDTFTIVRAQEGTTAANWPQGTLIEMRITRDTLTRFARVQEVLPEIATIDLMTAPVIGGNTSFILHDVDDEGAPIVAVKDTSTRWKFLNHHKILSTTVTSATTASVTAAAIGTAGIVNVVAGKYIIQFTSGAFSGQSRLITTSAGNVVNWGPTLSGTPGGGDAFDIYQSTYSLINAAQTTGNLGLPYAIVFGD